MIKGSRYLVQSGQKGAEHKTSKDYPDTIIGENMLFCRFPGSPSLLFLLGYPDVGGLGSRRADVLRGNRHQFSRLAGSKGKPSKRWGGWSEGKNINGTYLKVLLRRTATRDVIYLR